MATVELTEYWNYNDQAWETRETGAHFQNWASNGNGTYYNTFASGSYTTSYTYQTSNTVDSLITYARPRTINFTATNLAANADNLVITLGGTVMSPTPASGYAQGTDPNTVKADNYGTVKGSFEIPKDTIRTGKREVVIANDHNKALTTYNSSGIRRDITTTTHTAYQTHTTYTTQVVYDPIAESFRVNNDAVITSVDLFFASKPDSSDTHRQGITMQIRGFGDQGFPNSTVYAERTLGPDDVNVSDDGTVKTNFALEDPMFVKAQDTYCIVLITDSDKYEVYIAKMGEHKLSGYKDILAQQPYVDGVLYTSSNAQSWSISQESDLTFAVNCGTFNDSGTILFDPIVFGVDNFTDDQGNPIKDADGNPIKLSADQVVLLANYLTPDNTGLAWQMRYTTKDQPSTITVNDVAWIPLPNEISQDISKTLSQLQLEATFTTSSSLSPILALDDLTLGALLTAGEGKYISRNIDFSDSQFNAIKTTYEADIPDGASVTPYYSLDAGKTWVPYTNANVVKKQVDRNYYRYTLTVLLHDQQKGDMALETQFKGMIDMKSATPVLKPQVRRYTNTMIETDNSENSPVTTTTTTAGK